MHDSGTINDLYGYRPCVLSLESISIYGIRPVDPVFLLYTWYLCFLWETYVLYYNVSLLFQPSYLHNIKKYKISTKTCNFRI